MSSLSGVGLALPTIYRIGLTSSGLAENVSIEESVESVSHIISILLIISYAVFIFFQTRTHHGIYTDVFEEDEEMDQDRERDRQKAKLTMTECIIGLTISIALVTIIAITLVREIEPIVLNHGISDPFMGLILVPFVEKFAEHLTAIDEAWDNRINFALAHVLGATLQTALFNAPLTVIVGWGLRNRMDLDFEIFNLVMLLLAILTVGKFLQDQRSNYLEGFLLIILYVAIAVAAFHTPNPTNETEGESGASGSEEQSHSTAV